MKFVPVLDPFHRGTVERNLSQVVYESSGVTHFLNILISERVRNDGLRFRRCVALEQVCASGRGIVMDGGGSSMIYLHPDAVQSV
jgi:hypothetical protein